MAIKRIGNKIPIKYSILLLNHLVFEDLAFVFFFIHKKSITQASFKSPLKFRKETT